MIEIQERIRQIVNGSNGIKASFLCAQLSSEFIGYTKTEIKQVLIEMLKCELYEIEYVLPNGQNESLILPGGSRFFGASGTK